MGFTFLCKSVGSFLIADSGDSQVIVNWVKGLAQVKSLVLHHWMESIKCLMNCFSFLSFQHVYRDLNVEVDRLSKLELGPMDGRIMFRHFSSGNLCRSGSLDFFLVMYILKYVLS